MKSFLFHLQMSAEFQPSTNKSALERTLSLPDSLRSESNHNLMASGNFTFLKDAQKNKMDAKISQLATELHNTLPPGQDRNLPHNASHGLPQKNDKTDTGIEVLAVRVNPDPVRSSHVMSDGSLDSQSHTEYEVVDSNYTMSESDEEERWARSSQIQSDPVRSSHIWSEPVRTSQM